MDIATTVLCGAGAASEKYYFNPAFSTLPEAVKDELRSICVLFTAELGGTFLIVFDENGQLQLQTVRDEGDFDYDEIGAEMRVRRLQRDYEELFGQLEQFYEAFFLSEDI